MGEPVEPEEEEEKGTRGKGQHLPGQEERAEACNDRRDSEIVDEPA